MAYEVAYLDTANAALAKLPYEVAEALFHQLNLQLCEDVMGRSTPSMAPYPHGRIYRYSHELGGRVFEIHVLFRVGQGHFGTEQVQVLHIYTEIDRVEDT